MFKGLRSEVRDIQWLKKKDVFKQSGLVFGTIAIFSAFFMLYDLVIQKLMALIFG